MEYSTIILQKIISIFMLVLVGFVLVRVGVVKSKDNIILNKVAVNVLIPCMIVNSFQMEFSQERFHDILCLLGIGLAGNLLFMLLARLLKRPLKLNGVERASVIFSNNGSLVYPLVSALFGDAYIALATAYTLVQNFIVWTYGQWILTEGENGKKVQNIWKVFANPSVIAVVVSLGLFVARIKLPDIIGNTIGTFGNAMTPITMMAIGMVMGGIRLRNMAHHPRALMISVMRLLLCPIVAIGLCKLLNVGALLSKKELILIPILAMAAPGAMTIVNIQQLFGMDSEYAVSINIVTDVLCLVTMPLIILIGQAIVM